jgi:hypothetical protein
VSLLQEEEGAIWCRFFVLMQQRPHPALQAAQRRTRTSVLLRFHLVTKKISSAIPAFLALGAEDRFSISSHHNFLSFSATFIQRARRLFVVVGKRVSNMNLVRLMSNRTKNRQIFTPYSTALFTDTFFILRSNLVLPSPVGALPRSCPLM